MNVIKNDVIQINPEHRWGGCLAIVSEAFQWGVQAYAEIPTQGSAYIRLNHDDYERVGTAKFVKGDIDMQSDDSRNCNRCGRKVKDTHKWGYCIECIEELETKHA